MSIRRLIERLFAHRGSGHDQPQAANGVDATAITAHDGVEAQPAEERKRPPEPNYDRIRIVSVVDGTVISGHDAVKAHFDKEKRLLEEHGEAITFQIFRIDRNAQTLKEFQGERLAEVKVDGSFVSGSDTVATVKAKLNPLLRQEPKVSMKQGESATLLLNHRPMRDGTLFYADNFIMLPVWVQVFLHEGDFAQVTECAAKLARPPAVK